MDSKYILEKSAAGPRLGVADFNCRPGRSVLRDARVSTLDGRGYLLAHTNGPVSCKFSPDVGSPAEVKGARTSLKGSGPSAGGRPLHDTEKVSLPPPPPPSVSASEPVKRTQSLHAVTHNVTFTLREAANDGADSSRGKRDHISAVLIIQTCKPVNE